MSLAALLNDRLIQEVKKIGEVHKIGVSSKLAWPLRKDDTQNREAIHIFKKKKSFTARCVVGHLNC